MTTYGVMMGPKGSGKRTLLSSLSRSATLITDQNCEFIGQNDAIGDLNPPIVQWLKDGVLEYAKASPSQENYRFTIDAALDIPMSEKIFFWKDSRTKDTDLMVVNFKNESEAMFANSAVEHLKKSQYFVLTGSCADLDTPSPNAHALYFDNVARFFLQMYALDCSIDRVSIVLTEANLLPEDNQKSPEELALQIMGPKVFEVFCTLCPKDTKFSFFCTDAMAHEKTQSHPLSLEDWKPTSTIHPFLFSLLKHTYPKEFSVLEMNVKRGEAS